MTAVTVISRDNWFIQWSIVERYSVRIRMPAPVKAARTQTRTASM